MQFRGADIFFGRPNDETVDGHPLYGAGLEEYEFAEVLNSPWIAAAERRNRVHDRHDPTAFADLRHFVLPFHDSTFECIARGYEMSITEASHPWEALSDVRLRRG